MFGKSEDKIEDKIEEKKPVKKKATKKSSPKKEEPKKEEPKSSGKIAKSNFYYKGHWKIDEEVKLSKEDLDFLESKGKLK